VLIAAIAARGWIFTRAPGFNQAPKTGEIGSFLPVPGFAYLGKNNTGYAEYRHKVTGITFVLLPGGSFQMGSPETEAGSRTDEHPNHDVTLNPFLIAKYELTQSEWGRVMRTYPSREKGEGLPVTMISWVECQEFCMRTGLSLPSEAQWEYACRAGSSAAYAFGDSLPQDKANVLTSRTVPVDSGDPNRFGLYHMHGNVAEICQDAYEERFYEKPDASSQNPVCGSAFQRSPLRSYFKSSSPRRVVRGGQIAMGTVSEGSLDPVAYCRSASRSFRPPTWGEGALGLRPVRSLTASGPRSLKELTETLSQGVSWSEIRGDIAGYVHELQKEAAPCIQILMERGEVTGLELEEALYYLHALDPDAAMHSALPFLAHSNPNVRVRAALLIMTGQDSPSAQAVLREALMRRRDFDLSEWTIADAVEALAAERSPAARETLARFIATDDFGTRLKRVRPRIICTLTRCGIPDGLEYYLRLLSIEDNKLGQMELAEDVSVASFIASEIVENYAPLDPEVSKIRDSTGFQSQERLRAIREWLNGQLASLK
jgi:formylglycine-generating enzyme required for sulfatase activity